MNTNQCVACKSNINKNASVCHYCQMPQHSKYIEQIANLLKWAGGITALLTLCITVFQVNEIFDNLKNRKIAINQLVQAGNLQRTSKDYQTAWDSYETALKLDPGFHSARKEQIALAQVWLRNIWVVKGEDTFSKLVNKMLPTLYIGAAISEGKESANISAHIGWAYYLKYREGNANKEQVESHFKRSLQTDQNNGYAHAMFAFWKGYNGKPIEELKRHFKKGLLNKNTKDYTRILQLSTYLSKKTDGYEKELFRIVNNMCENKEKILPRYQYEILNIYQRNMYDSKRIKEIIHYLTPKAHLFCISCLTNENKPHKHKRQQYQLVKGIIFEEMGDIEKALNIYQSLQKEIYPHTGRLSKTLNKAIERIKK